MPNNDDDNFSSLDVYKYRRDNVKVVIHPDITLRRSNDTSQNILIEFDKDQRPKTYAILQESGHDFTHSKLRNILIIYSNPAWTVFTLFTLFLVYLLETCLYTFWKSKERSFLLIVIAICLNVVFTLDVAIIVGLKLSKKWRKTLNLVEPDTKKVILDIVLAMPYSVLFLVESDTTLLFDFHAIAPLMAMIRVYRIIGYAYNRSSQAGTNQWTIFLAQYLILLFLSVHTWTCIWFLFSYRHFNVHKIHTSWSASTTNLPTETTFDWYLVCLYWSIMFFTTNALGDLYPVTTAERVTATIAILLGFFLTTIVFVGSLTSQFITMTTRRAKYVRQLKKINNHLQLINMDPDTSKRIIGYAPHGFCLESNV